MILMGKLKKLERNLSQCFAVHWTDPATNMGCHREKPVTNHLSYGNPNMVLT
jgi:hypothetical protein